MRMTVAALSPASLFVAERLQAEGHQTTYLLIDPNRHTQGVPGRGLIKTVKVRPEEADLTGWIEAESPSDAVVVFDGTSTPTVRTGETADALRHKGRAVLGASVFADTLEHDRAFGLSVMEQAGIQIPRSQTFKTFEEGIKFAKTHPTYLIFKPHHTDEAAKTIVSETHEQFLHELEVLQASWKGEAAFVLQEHVEGIEVSYEGWFDGDGWVDGAWNSTVEEKRFLTGGLGQNVGCAGNVVWSWAHPPRVLRAALRPLATILQRVGYVGPLDLNTKGGKGLEFTPRLGFDSFAAWLRLLQGDLARLIAALAAGDRPAIRLTPAFAAAIRLSIPPYPHEHHVEESYGTLVEVSPTVREWFLPGDVEQQDGRLIAAGHDGVIGVMTATHADLRALNALVYNRVRQVTAQDLQYRTDVLTFRAMREIPEIRAEAPAMQEVG